MWVVLYSYVWVLCQRFCKPNKIWSYFKGFPGVCFQQSFKICLIKIRLKSFNKVIKMLISRYFAQGCHLSLNGNQQDWVIAFFQHFQLIFLLRFLASQIYRLVSIVVVLRMTYLYSDRRENSTITQINVSAKGESLQWEQT